MSWQNSYLLLPDMNLREFFLLPKLPLRVWAVPIPSATLGRWRALCSAETGKKGVSNLKILWLDQDLPQPCKALGMWGYRIWEKKCPTPLGVKAEGQHLLYPGRFPESQSKPGLGREPFIVISVFIQPVARSDKALFSRSKCSNQSPQPAGAAQRRLCRWASLGDTHFPTTTPEKRNGPRSLPLDQIHRSCYTQHSFAIW